MDRYNRMEDRVTSTIFYEPVGGVVLPTARPDAFWCELVRVFVPDKSRETGDDDPYGAGAIELTPHNAEALLAMIPQWPEAEPLFVAASTGIVMVHREP